VQALDDARIEAQTLGQLAQVVLLAFGVDVDR
jgi:hypothetical protein